MLLISELSREGSRSLAVIFSNDVHGSYCTVCHAFDTEHGTEAAFQVHFSQTDELHIRRNVLVVLFHVTSVLALAFLGAHAFRCITVNNARSEVMVLPDTGCSFTLSLLLYLTCSVCRFETVKHFLSHASIDINWSKETLTLWTWEVVLNWYVWQMFDAGGCQIAADTNVSFNHFKAQPTVNFPTLAPSP